jgi:hypothetical protein
MASFTDSERSSGIPMARDAMLVSSREPFRNHPTRTFRYVDGIVPPGREMYTTSHRTESDLAAVRGRWHKLSDGFPVPGDEHGLAGLDRSEQFGEPGFSVRDRYVHGTDKYSQNKWTAQDDECQGGGKVILPGMGCGSRWGRSCRRDEWPRKISVRAAENHGFYPKGMSIAAKLPGIAAFTAPTTLLT